MKFYRLLLLCFVSTGVALSANSVFSKSSFKEPIDVLVWDDYFEPSDSAWPKSENNLGQWGDVIAWDPEYRSPSSGTKNRKLHGLKASYVIGKNNPNVRIHRLHDAFLPWQDPEVCILMNEQTFNQILQSHGYKPLEECRQKLEKRIIEVSHFIRERNIRFVNISHGTAWNGFRRGYATRNPMLLSKTYPKLDMDDIHKFVYHNYMAIGEIIETLFTNNPDTLFIVSSGNNGDDIDRELPMQWPMEKFRYFPVPTWYSSFGSRLDNLIAVAASEDGEKIWSGSDIGVAADFAHKTGSYLAPDEGGSMKPFAGTSGAAAETTRLMVKAALSTPRDITLSPRFLKNLARQTATPKPTMTGKVWSNGILEDEIFLNSLDTLIHEGSIPQKTSEHKENIKTKKLKVVQKTRYAEAFRIVPKSETGQPKSCETVRVAKNGMIWTSYPNQNAIIRFDPTIQERKDFLLTPRPGEQRYSGPDGLAIGSEGKIWYGEYQKGAMGMIDPKTEKIHSFSNPQGTVAILGIGGNPERVWSTNHQSRHVYEFNPARHKFMKTWKLSLSNPHHEWPRDVRADNKNQVFVTAGGFRNGSLIRIDTNTGQINDFPLKLGPDEDAVALWLATNPTDRYVYISAERNGFYIFDKWTEQITNYQREDGREWQNYWATTARQDGKIAFGNSASDSFLAVDVFDPKKPGEIISYQIPDQQGLFKEAMDFDNEGRLWYCLIYTDIVGRLEID